MVIYIAYSYIYKQLGNMPRGHHTFKSHLIKTQTEANRKNTL